MTTGMHRTERGTYEMTRRALMIAGSVLTVLTTAAGALVGATVWRVQTAAAIASKVDNNRFIADSVRLDIHVSDENAHYQQLLHAVEQTRERVSDIWCEDHFHGSVPKSCQ